MNRDDAAAAITEGTGKTREQAQAFLDILGSAFRRRGWVEGELDWAITDVPLPSGGFGIKYPTRVFERTGSRGAHIANSLALPGLTELVDEANNLRRAYEAKVAELAAETARHSVGGQAEPSDAQVEAAAAMLWFRTNGGPWTDVGEDERPGWREEARCVLVAAAAMSGEQR